MRNESTSPFDSLDPKAGVCVADGWGIRIHVRRGQLTILDGSGRHRRQRVFSRAQSSGIKRLVVLGNAGSVTLDAIRWLADVGTALVHLDREGRLLAASTGVTNDDPRLRRAQALAAGQPIGQEISRYLIDAKLRGQASVLEWMGAATDEVEQAREALSASQSASGTMRIEAAAAAAYWDAWATIPLRFPKADLRRLPESWLSFGQRTSPLSSSPRLAVNPANAALNYLYAILEAECRLACLTVGLDPGLGALHADQRNRDSMALDVMEAVRPEVDAYVLKMLASRRFRARDFHETRRGVCRVLPPLSHVLAETAPTWARSAGAVAERVARMLADETGFGSIPTPLTQENRSRGRDRVRGAPKQGGKGRAVALPKAACSSCGILLKDSSRRYCDECLLNRRREVVGPRREAGLQALSDLRRAGKDPAHGGMAARKRGETVSRQHLENAQWDRANRSPRDRQVYEEEIMPRLRSVDTTRISEATGLSRNYARLIKQGRVPHPRHWNALKSLGQRAPHDGQI